MPDNFTPITSADRVRALRLILSGLNSDADAANAVFAEANAATDGLVHLSMCLADVAAVTVAKVSAHEHAVAMVENDITVLLDAADGQSDA